MGLDASAVAVESCVELEVRLNVYSELDSAEISFGQSESQAAEHIHQRAEALARLMQLCYCRRIQADGVS